MTDNSQNSPTSPLDGLAEFFGRHRWLFAVGILAMSTVATLGYFGDPPAERSRIDDASDADEELLEAVSENFERASGGESFVVVECDDLFTPDNIAAVRRLVDDVEELPGIRSVIWIERFVMFDELGIPQPLLPREGTAIPVFEEDYEIAEEEALENPLLVGQLISADAKTLLMPVLVDRDEVDSRREVTDRLNQIAEEASSGSPLRVRMTGNWPLRYAERDAVDREELRFQIIGYCLVFVIAAFLFRSLPAVLIVAGAPALGVFWTLGILGLMNEPENGIAEAILPILITMVGFTDGVHLMEHIRQMRARGRTNIEAAQSAIRRLGLPCALTSLTTAIGFGSLMIAEAEIIRGFGRACAVGVVCTFVAVITVIPLLSSTRLGNSVHSGVKHDIIGRALPQFEGLINGTIRHAKLVTTLGILLTLTLAGIALTLRPDNKMEYQLPTGSVAYAALAHCDDVFGGIQFINVHVEWPETVSAESNEFLNAIADVEQVLSAEPLIHNPTSVRTVLLYMPAATDDLTIRIPYLKYLPDELTGRYFRRDDRETLVVARVQDLGIARYEPVFTRIEQELAGLEQQHRGFRFRLTGGPVVWGRNLSQIVTDLASSLGIAAGIILVVMGLVYRSLKIGLITIIPNMFPLVSTATFLVLMGRSLEVASVCAFTICLGIAVDDTIHFLSRFKYELEVDNDVSGAIRRAFMAVGTALIITTVVLVSGFSVVLTSELPTHRVFAGMCCSTIGAALIGDLLLLPAMLTVFFRQSDAAAVAGDVDPPQREATPAMSQE